MVYYSHTCGEIERYIARVFPNTRPCEHGRDRSAERVLWMIQEINAMPETIKGSLKAARWIGYVLHMCEELGFWHNGHSRDLIRKDVESGNDRPAA
jgi:hypothetical protein